MAKKVIAFNYVRAFEILYGEWHSIDPCDNYEGDDKQWIISSKELSAEEQCIKQEAWKGLSTEAKEVIMAILSSPKEITEMLKTPQRELWSKKRIQKYFVRSWMSKFITELTIKEIRNWANQL